MAEKRLKRPCDPQLIGDIATGQVEDATEDTRNHCHALSIYFMHYNFARIHQTTRVTPAMAAGVTEKLWDMSDIVHLIAAYERGEVLETERKFGGKIGVGPQSKTAHTYE